MPNIKIEPRQQTIGVVPATRMPDQDVTSKVADTSAPWAALAKAGTQIEDVGQKLLEAENQNQFHKARTEILTMSAQVEDSFKSRRDHENFEADLDKMQEEARQSFQSKYGLAFKRIEPHLDFGFAQQRIVVKHLADTQRVKGLKADWMQAGDNFAELIARADDPQNRAALLSEYESYTASLKDVGALDDIQAQQAIQRMRSRSSLTAFRIDLNRNVDEAERRLTVEKDMHYPYLHAEDEIRAGNLIEARRRDLDRKEAAARKEVYAQGAKEAYDRRLAWKKGKSPDGVPFQEYLMIARENDTISESTYQHHMNAIERAADRAASGERKMSSADWVRWGKTRAEYLDPNSTKDWDDIYRDTSGFPAARAHELADMLSSKPSKQRRAVISNEWNYVSRRLSESKATADTWKQVNDQWNARLPLVKEDKDIPALARDLVKEIPQGGFSPMLEQLRKEKEAQKNKPGIMQRIFKWNPSTQKLEGGKK